MGDAAQVEAEIRRAFAGVTREGGRSWHDAGAMDGLSPEELPVLRDRCWEDLIDDPAWNPGHGMGGFWFLDDIGMNYYLAPALVRAVRGDLDFDISFHLHRPTTMKWRERFDRRMALLTDEQRGCLRHVADSMMRRAADEGNDVEFDDWGRVIESLDDWEQARCGQTDQAPK